jgi:AcrR family transcriptional regulator
MTERVKRSYQSPARAESAEATRARIRAAASRLFVERGYVATTMKAVAAAAGVGERTLYDAFPAKSALFQHALDVAVVGDEQPVPVAKRPAILALRSQTDPVAALTHLVDYTTDLLERAGDLIMVSVQAAGADPDMRATADAGAQATLRVHLELAQQLDDRGALRAGLSPDSAADIAYALASPHVHQLLRRHRSWTAQQYRDWLRGAVIREFLP